MPAVVFVCLLNVTTRGDLTIESIFSTNVLTCYFCTRISLFIFCFICNSNTIINGAWSKGGSGKRHNCIWSFTVECKNASDDICFVNKYWQWCFGCHNCVQGAYYIYNASFTLSPTILCRSWMYQGSRERGGK